MKAEKTVEDLGDGKTFTYWTAHDGSRWRNVTAGHMWFGWMPGEDGTWYYNDKEAFRRDYPEVLRAQEADNGS